MEKSDTFNGLQGIVTKVRRYSIFNQRDVELQMSRIDGARNAPITITVRTVEGKEITGYSPRIPGEMNGQRFLFYKDYNVGEMFP